MDRLLHHARTALPRVRGSARSRLIEKKPAPIRHSPGCQGFHTDRYCARDPRCERCGKRNTDHQVGAPCHYSEQCANCHGPSPASHSDCPAKPVRKDGHLVHPTKRQLNRIRQAGLALYKSKHPEPTPKDATAPVPRTAAVADGRTRETPLDKDTPGSQSLPASDPEVDNPMEGIQEAIAVTVEPSTIETRRPRRGGPRINYNERNEPRLSVTAEGL